MATLREPSDFSGVPVASRGRVKKKEKERNMSVPKRSRTSSPVRTRSRTKKALVAHAATQPVEEKVDDALPLDDPELHVHTDGQERLNKLTDIMMLITVIAIMFYLIPSDLRADLLGAFTELCQAQFSRYKDFF